MEAAAAVFFVSRMAGSVADRAVQIAQATSPTTASSETQQVIIARETLKRGG